MVVDDSSLIRGVITRMLYKKNIKVVASSSDGSEAIEVLKAIAKNNTNYPDIITLDIEMPNMDGLTALPKILELSPKSKVIMISSITQKGAEVTIKALDRGASDFIPKPIEGEASLKEFEEQLISKVYALSGFGDMQTMDVKEKAFNLKPVPLFLKPQAIAIASSTGGPQALGRLFENLKGANINLPFFITQHMPPSFTKMFADQLKTISGLKVFEAHDNQKVEKGEVYIAPGDYHMVVEKKESDIVIRIMQTPPENFCRPAADPMFRSIAKIYGKSVIVVILTGMGQDGLLGAREISDLGGIVLAQNKSTSIVWGMPRAVAEAGICSKVGTVPTLAECIKKLCSGIPV